MNKWLRRELKIWERSGIVYTPDGWIRVGIISHILRYQAGMDLR